MTTTIKINGNTRDKLKELKNLLGLKSLDECVASLVDSELSNYCYTFNGYAQIGAELKLDDEMYQIVDIADSMVYARSGDKVIEFHKRGKIAWEASIV